MLPRERFNNVDDADDRGLNSRATNPARSPRERPWLNVVGLGIFAIALIFGGSVLLMGRNSLADVPGAETAAKWHAVQDELANGKKLDEIQDGPEIKARWKAMGGLRTTIVLMAVMLFIGGSGLIVLSVSDWMNKPREVKHRFMEEDIGYLNAMLVGEIARLSGSIVGQVEGRLTAHETVTRNLANRLDTVLDAIRDVGGRRPLPPDPPPPGGGRDRLGGPNVPTPGQWG